MNTPSPMRAVCVSAAYALEPDGGGVQRCTREYLDVLRAAGFVLETVTYDIDRRPLTRLRRLLAPRPYRDLIRPDVMAAAVRTVQEHGASWLLFNQNEAAPLAATLAPLKQIGVRFALLSHGPDSADYVHTVRLGGRLHGTTRACNREARWLGQQLFAEMDQLRHFDVVFCLSETDRHLQQWLGGRAVHILPRIVAPEPLAWAPRAGRVGTVCTLDHAPNREGLLELCDAFKGTEAPIELRLVGRPSKIGHEFTRAYPFVSYLGSLTDQQLRAEAASWCAFVNPVFCYARGCSTKLAVALGWQLPIATTRAGARGYVWDEELVSLHETPAELAAAARRLAGPSEAARQRSAVIALANRAPKLPDLAALVRGALA